MRPVNADLRTLDRALESGLLVFRPTFVRRLYADGGRLRRPRGTGRAGPRPRMWQPERWIASTVLASHPRRHPGEGLSVLHLSGRHITLRQALRWRAERILGAERAAAYGRDLPVLIKILDPGEPIVFHVHATDADVARRPARFLGQRRGKDEAYYFLPAPRGPVPYTHVGLYPGVTATILAVAIERGTVLDLSPVFHQRPGEGFFVPAGIPHRPGTALTLEIQQASDVYTLLERRWGDRVLSAREMHPGFPTLREALALVDVAASTDPHLLDRHRLAPEPIAATRSRGGEEAWIFPPRLRRFSGKRVIVRTRFESVERGPYVLLVWRGRGRLLGARLRPGTEALLTAEAATRPHLYEAEGEPLELFKLFPPAVEAR